MKPVSTIALSASLLTLIACAPHNDHAQHDDTPSAHTEHSTPQKDAAIATIADIGITVSKARVQPPFPGRDVAAGFFTLSNIGPADRLIGATSDISKATEIHTHLSEDGVMKMRRIDRIDVGENATLIFKPGGYHLMMFGTEIAADKTEAVLTLEFETAGHVSVRVPIRDITDMDDDASNPHAGHDNH